MKKRIVDTQFYGTWLLIVLLTFSACGPQLYFQEPQPEGWPILTEFPEDFHGKWGESPEGGFILITQGIIYTSDTIKRIIPLDSLSYNGLVLEGDSLFQIEVDSSLWYQMQAHLQPPQPDQDSTLSKETTPLTNKQDSLISVEKIFLGKVGETILKENLDEQSMLYLMHLPIGPQPFIHQDSMRISIRRNSLHILNSTLVPFWHIYANVVVKAGEGYLFLNEPVPDENAWSLSVMHKADDTHLRFTSLGAEIELARAFFDLKEAPHAVPGDTLNDHFASPTVEELMRFLKADSLDWEEWERGW